MVLISSTGGSLKIMSLGEAPIRQDRLAIRQNLEGHILQNDDIYLHPFITKGRIKCGVSRSQYSLDSSINYLMNRRACCSHLFFLNNKRVLDKYNKRELHKYAKLLTLAQILSRRFSSTNRDGTRLTD